MNPYEVLGVRKNSRPNTVRKAYRKLSMKYHADRNVGDDEAARRYEEVQRAYAILSDPERKRHYDETGDAGEPTKRFPEEYDFAEFLLPALMYAVAEVERHCADVTRTDLVKKMRDKIKADMIPVERRRAEIEKAKKLATKLLGRSTVKDGRENILESNIRSQLAQIERDLADTLNTLDRMTRALDYLKDVTYRTDGKPATEMDALLAGNYAVMKWSW